MREPRSTSSMNEAPFITNLKSSLANTFISKRHIIYFTETDSTNIRAHEFARAGYPEGTLVLAESQNSGQGQFGRSWHSPAGKGIYLSLILRPQASPARMPGITLMTAVCLAETFIESCKLDISIKWPNDILVRERKLSGILTEMSTSGDTLEYIIVGVGINLSQKELDFPGEIRESATSLMIETGTSHDRASLIKHFLEGFERAYRVFVEKGVESIAQRWCTLSGIIGRHVLVDRAGSTLEGAVSGIDSNGSLIICCSDGHEQSVISGTLSFRK